jgi:hypothetical protein
MTYILGIQGDGNAVGNNNRITVIKQQNHHYGGGNKTKGGGKDDGIGAAAIAMTLALAGASFYFALYSETIYIVLRILAGLEAIGAVWAIYLYGQREAYAIATKMVVVAALSTIGYFALTAAHENYPKEIVDLAQHSGGVRTFWCGLNVYGRQLALLHTLTAGIGFSIGLLFLLPVCTVATFFGYFEIAVSESTYGWLARMSSWVLIVLGGFFICTASYFHTPAGWNTWSESIKEPPSLLFCVKQK